MSQSNAIAVFDVGKTNKKLLVFDSSYRIVLEESVHIEEIVDEDGFTCENVAALILWITEKLDQALSLPGINIRAVNFSAYGASLVYIDGGGRVVAPLYNYLKPYPAPLQDQLYHRYGGSTKFSMQTASPPLGSLNSGLQLYRMQMEQPTRFNEIHYALHLPQFLRYLVLQQPCSDITSIGCHTAMWDFETNDYHQWITEENLKQKLAPIVSCTHFVDTQWRGHRLLVGTGLHDSSAALIPYMMNYSEPFALISTGTWSITLNAFNPHPLTEEELEEDCLCYLSYKGTPVKASRLFAGYIHDQQVRRLSEYFNAPPDHHTHIKPDHVLIEQLTNAQADNQVILFENLPLSDFVDYSAAYHWLVADIIRMQVEATNLVLQNTPVQTLYVDGGFGRNRIYMQLLANAYPHFKVFAATAPRATAMGAALVGHEYWNTEAVPENLLEPELYAPAHTR